MSFQYQHLCIFNRVANSVFQPQTVNDDTVAGHLGAVSHALGASRVPTPRFSVEGSVGQGGKNVAGDVARVRSRLHELGYDWAEVDTGGGVTAAFIDAIKLFQGVVSGHATWTSRDGLVEPGKGTERWLQAINAPKWVQLDDGGLEVGYRYLIADLTNGDDRYCVDWTADVIRAVGLEYRRLLGPTADARPPISVHELSGSRGGNSGHAGHRTGMNFDIRLPRLDGGVGSTVTDASYDRDTTRIILHALRSQPLIRGNRLYLSDDVLVSEGLCLPLEDHHHHIHARVNPPPRGPVDTE